GTNRSPFWCPATKPEYQWKLQPGNPNRLGMTIEPGVNDLHAVRASPTGSFFSYGYNDWGGGPVTLNSSLSLGLGGDVNAPAVPEMPESRVRKPSDMIMLGDSTTDS